MEKYSFSIAKLDIYFLGPGYVNEPFSHIPVLRAKVLGIWERERALMPERSYKVPKGRILLVISEY